MNTGQRNIFLAFLLFGYVTPILAQPEDAPIGVLVIPSIDLVSTIVTIPLASNGTWDMAYAPSEIGWLEHTQWIDGNTPLAVKSHRN